MNSEQLVKAVLLTMALAGVTPAYSNERTGEPPAMAREGATSGDVQQMMRRLEEIEAMDTRSLSRKERRALQKEVSDIDKKVQHGGYVTISVGALIIIVLLLILI